MRIGIIGAGQVGSTLARKLAKIGHTVKLANSRGVASVSDIASEVGALAVSAIDAVKNVEVVILAIPETRITYLSKDLFDTVDDDVVVVDTGNYYPGFRDDQIEDIEGGMPESRWVSQQIGRSVVKAFNSISANSLMVKGRPSGTENRVALPVSGDDTRKKELVIGLIESLGFDGIDAGSLDESWRQQPGTPAYCTDFSVVGVRNGLATAEKERAPALRDLGIKKMMQLREGATPKDL